MTATWQCPAPDCPFEVRGEADADVLAEIERSHGRKHRAPSRDRIQWPRPRPEPQPFTRRRW